MNKLPEDLRYLLNQINAGTFDAHLDHVLAITHERKRALRGRSSFPLPPLRDKKQ